LNFRKEIKNMKTNQERLDILKEMFAIRKMKNGNYKLTFQELIDVLKTDKPGVTIYFE